jgi:hypothetical protein
MPIDFKKTQKDLYMPKNTPSLIDVPEMIFFMVDGMGNPNTNLDYKTALDILYGLSYGIKMSKMSGTQPDGYVDFVVPPLEGLWWFKDGDVIKNILDKDNFCWTSMVRQPEFVTNEVFETAKTALSRKKPDMNLSRVRFEKFTEGFCAQIMHIGAYDDEPATIAVLEEFIGELGYIPDFTSKRRHHEIYLSDPRKTAPEKLKTVIRYPIGKR